jgi:hypothetical protein
MNKLRKITVCAALMLGACGGSDPGVLGQQQLPGLPPGSGLTQSNVSNLPPGDAQGSAFAGNYVLAIYTTSCTGVCPLVDGLSSCDVGHESQEVPTVSQTNGRLELDDLNLYVPRLVGGIDADGSFDIGGFATQLGGVIAIANRATGTVTSPDILAAAMSATSEEHITGTTMGITLDCVATYSVTGARDYRPPSSM